MRTSDAFWHIVNFFVPALVLGGIAAAAARLIWRREVARASVWRLWLCAGTAAALADFAGLAVFGHDGKMLTYAAMVVASAGAIWWSGLKSRAG